MCVCVRDGPSWQYGPSLLRVRGVCVRGVCVCVCVCPRCVWGGAGEGNLSLSLDCCSVTSFYIAQLILIQHIHDGPSWRGAAQVLGSGDEPGC